MAGGHSVGFTESQGSTAMQLSCTMVCVAQARQPSLDTNVAASCSGFTSPAQVKSIQEKHLNMIICMQRKQKGTPQSVGLPASETAAVRRERLRYDLLCVLAG